jgi:hypothetical protein
MGGDGDQFNSRVKQKRKLFPMIRMQDQGHKYKFPICKVINIGKLFSHMSSNDPCI